MKTRQDTLEHLRQHPEVEVLIVGGGVNGIGVFRDLALQGVKVLLVERGDFCSGASAASSHMVHGGLRYLENGEFRLVREALRERNLLLHNAPHQVKPLPTTIPIFRRLSGILNAPLKFLNLTEKPAERGALVIKIGLTLYDWFTRGQRGLPTHQFFSRQASLEKRPHLNPDISYTARYYDAWMPSPERICIEMIQDAEAAHPDAYALNYMPLVGGGGDSVSLEDRLTGEKLSLKPQVVVNAAGPWIDLANQRMERPTHFIGGTKGSHLVVDHPDLHAAVQGEEIFFENDDGRIVLCFPLMDRVLIGTTDIRIEDPDEARCTEAEIDYLLGMLKRVFPDLSVARSQIVFTFSGVRPLPASEAGATGRISRDHSCEITEANGVIHFPIFSLVGGKWTTFRAFGEQVVDLLLPRLGKTRQGSTEQLPIGGGRDYPQDESAQAQWVAALAQETGLSAARVQKLFERYGTWAAELARFCAQGEDAALQHHPDYSQREITYLVQQEKVQHLDDLVLRRSLLAMLGYLTRPSITELAGLVAGVLGWDANQQAAEEARLLDILAKNHLVTLA